MEQLEPLQNKDLKRFRESTRRRLYDMLAESIFGASKDEEDIKIKDFDADDVQLEVIWLHGRWFGKWTWPRFKSRRIRGENRKNMVRLSIRDGKLMQDEV